MKPFAPWLVLLFLSIGLCPYDANSAERQIRIATYNVQCLMAPRSRASKLVRYRWDIARREHLERVANVIETVDPDILNLCEVTSEESVELLVSILHEKGLKEYQGYHVESKDGFTGFDVALISKFKPDEVEGQSIRCIYSYADDSKWREKYTFTNDEGMVESRETSLSRNALYYFTIDGHKIGLMGLHLKSDPGDAYSNGRRTGEATIVRRIIREEIIARGYSPIVLGDLNDYDPVIPDRDPDRSSVTDVFSILTNYDPKSDEPELANTMEKIERVADRYSSHWDVNENGTADIGDVYTMIDHILIPREWMPNVKRSFVARVNDLKTSDHWPVVVDLVLPKK